MRDLKALSTFRDWLRRRSRRTPEETLARAEAKRKAQRIRQELLAYRTSADRRLGRPYRPSD